MRLLITGVCGFVGSAVAEALLERREGLEICGIDSLQRPGSETNRGRLAGLGIRVMHGDIRAASDFENLPPADWVIDAAANPSVLAGVQGNGSSRQLFEHNLASLVNVAEFCKRHGAGLVVLSSSRVYSIPALAALPLLVRGNAFELDASAPLPTGVCARGIGASFSTAPPISLYGATKLACEVMALEYGAAFGFPVWVDRCGVLAGAGQFGTPDQGIFSYWVNAHLQRRPLRYIGFGGCGRQVRDAFHPRDLAALLDAQMAAGRKGGRRLYVAGGGTANAMSLAQLNAWCDVRFGTHTAQPDPRERPYDIPWVVMDSSDAAADFGWAPQVRLPELLEAIAEHAQQHPDWLERSGL
jgi:CDP-paratose 2-epimerase